LIATSQSCHLSGATASSNNHGDHYGTERIPPWHQRQNVLWNGG
jgi:hypothetical protein